MGVFETVVAWWCVRSASAITTLPLHRRTKKKTASNMANALYETILKSWNSLYYYHHETNIFCKITFYFTAQRTFTMIKVPKFPEISAYKNIRYPYDYKFMIFRKSQNILVCDVPAIQKSKSSYPDRHFPLETSKKK